MSASVARADPERARLLLVPGNDLDARFYAPLCARLAADGVTAVALTLPAFQGRPDGPTTWPALVAAVREQAAAHLGDAGTLAGHSLGGLLALLAADPTDRPPAIRRLALLEPAVAPWAWLARRAAARYEREVLHGARDRFVNQTSAFRRVADEARYPRWALDLYLEARRTGDPAVVGGLLAALPALYPLPTPELPTLLLHGAASGRSAALGARLLARRFGAARHEIRGAGHWLANEADEALAARLGAFARDDR